MTPLRGPFVLLDGTDPASAGWGLHHGRPDEDPDAPDDAAERLALLTAVGEGRAEQVVRLLRPAPTAAFSRRDSLLPGFRDAQDVARRHGFTPVVRPVGGRMAPYHRGCLVLDVVGRSDDPRAGTAARFEVVADAVVAALGHLGAQLGEPLDAQVGAVPREYCPGEHSVHLPAPTAPSGGPAGVAVKVAGTAQRQTRRAYLVSALLVVTDTPAGTPDTDPADDGSCRRTPSRPLRAVTEDVYAALGLDLDPATVGAVADCAPSATVEDAAAALVSALSGHLDLLRPAVGAVGRVAP